MSCSKRKRRMEWKGRRGRKEVEIKHEKKADYIYFFNSKRLELPST